MKVDDLSLEEATEILDSSLTEEDIGNLIGVKNDINANIRWGAVTGTAFGPIIKSLETIIFEGGEGLVKRIPIESLFPRDRALLEGGDKAQIQRHYVLLLLMKKLLGALKTKTKKALADIPRLSFEEEYAATMLLEDKETEEGKRTAGFRCDDPETIDFLARMASEEDGVCQHARTKVRQVEVSGFTRPCNQLQTFCKDCKTIIKSVLVANTKIPRKKEKCKHRAAAWVEGKEGQVAQCVGPSCDYLITSPEELQRIRWEVAGLEPYGDDPSQDEVIVL